MRCVHALSTVLIAVPMLQDVPAEQKTSMLVLSEFVGCSPSVSGAIRVNPWSIDDVADRIHEVCACSVPAARVFTLLHDALHVWQMRLRLSC